MSYMQILAETGKELRKAELDSAIAARKQQFHSSTTHQNTLGNTASEYEGRWWTHAATGFGGICGALGAIQGNNAPANTYEVMLKLLPMVEHVTTPGSKIAEGFSQARLTNLQGRTSLYERKTSAAEADASRAQQQRQEIDATLAKAFEMIIQALRVVR